MVVVASHEEPMQTAEVGLALHEDDIEVGGIVQ